MLLRHAQAQPESEQSGDFERQLTAQGEAEANAVGLRIASLGAPDVILASPAERTRRTASIVAHACGMSTALIRFEPSLYLAGPDAIWAQIARRPAAETVVLICGHNPGLSQLACRLGTNSERVDLPTTGLIGGAWPHGEWNTVRPEAAARCALVEVG
jgi:phosphohistidine phosphatase